MPEAIRTTQGLEIFIDTIQETNLIPTTHTTNSLPPNRPTPQPPNHPTEQPINRTTNQPTNQSTDQPNNQSTDQPNNQSTDQPNNQPPQKIITYSLETIRPYDINPVKRKIDRSASGQTAFVGRKKQVLDDDPHLPGWKTPSAVPNHSPAFIMRRRTHGVPMTPTNACASTSGNGEQ
ncbi:MAG: hypothetical protein KFF50_13570 [Desulfatitalea sp.]|nr:hypothetical protein [Desulfatitalea sp.]